MYPTLHSNNTGPASSSYQPSQQAGSNSRDARNYVANGPVQLASAASTSSALPVLRVQIAEHLSVTPQVMISSETGNIPRTEFSQSYEFEHQILQDFSSETEAPTSVVDEGVTPDMRRYEQLGHDRKAVAMALLAVTTTEDRDSQVLKFLEDYSNLKAMGFAPETVTGAMIAYPNDITEATEACLNAST